MKISANGMADIGLRAIRQRCELYHAKAAISCFHDALLAVALGKITPEQVKEFFWGNDLERTEFIGGVLYFEEKEPT
jgi:hypothetical protein